MKFSSGFTGLMIALSAFTASAQNAEIQVKTKSADPGMMATLQSLYPSTQFKEINTTAVPGIYEVVMGQNVAYTDQTGRYFFFGRLYDMQTQEDLTVGKAENASRIEIKDLKHEDAIKTVKGNGKRILYVFSDPDCPYCKQLEKNLVDLTDVTIYTFLFPLESIHPDAKRKAIEVWCSKDKVKAWDDLMLKDIESGTPACEHPVDRNIALGDKFGITGTPTLISADGRKLPGAATAERISQWLNSGN